MNPTFNIVSTGIDTDTSHLLIEAGPAGISFVAEDANGHFPTLIVYAFPFDMNAIGLAKELEEILQKEPLLQKQFKKTDIVWAFPEAILVPNEYMNQDHAGDMLNLVYGDLNAGEMRSDFMFKHNLHCAYRVPQPVADVMSRHFLYANQTHQYSLLPELCAIDGEQLYVIFYNNRLTAMLHKEGSLQVIQSLLYQSPEDAAYHLLNICQSFDMAIDKLLLKFCGMIDEQSNLYTALYKYFINIQFVGMKGDLLTDERIKKLENTSKRKFLQMGQHQLPKFNQKLVF